MLKRPQTQQQKIQENNSFDHYFGTYPNATNPPGEPKFIVDPHTPSINGLLSAGLLTSNPNSANPFPLDRYHKITDQTSIIRFIEDNWGLG
jgi:phospholipase C